ncbi:hypothetical protein PR001_g6443 [Phytophthora rubi]|uniref:Uncharacterized protein n=1 Tax=Phytophthora rubi TaxID=129364 RepID=A0A6A3MQ77_9STRA|nr:hypothetical protein PR002_g7697 [Phytophthora rubi]KAE9041850.1 hypothetical protein PR001_g6443 [Phytophthora rubi]
MVYVFVGATKNELGCIKIRIQIVGQRAVVARVVGVTTFASRDILPFRIVIALWNVRAYNVDSKHGMADTGDTSSDNYHKNSQSDTASRRRRQHGRYQRQLHARDAPHIWHPQCLHALTPRSTGTRNNSTHVTSQPDSTSSDFTQQNVDIDSTSSDFTRQKGDTDSTSSGTTDTDSTGSDFTHGTANTDSTNGDFTHGATSTDSTSGDFTHGMTDPNSTSSDFTQLKVDTDSTSGDFTHDQRDSSRQQLHTYRMFDSSGSSEQFTHKGGFVLLDEKTPN